MGPPPTNPMLMSGSAHLAAQHERLILELLPFKDSPKFQEWLHGALVRGSWAEFHRDYLATKTPAPGAPQPGPETEPDKSKTAQAAKDAINSRSQKFLVYHPDKTGWAPEDHYVRFIVTVVQDNMLRYLWSESDWKKRAVEITKAVYEVLCYLRATYVFAEPSPPSYYSH
ncbi:hypothetical protein PT974_00958 [Cladobotryum mycophilum]|uniref:Uncharacterized protein n=1 Tax=Cladobotryum mycophilum TaxID=491253 RepID=A0ABR0T2C4_9HYPO